MKSFRTRVSIPPSGCLQEEINEHIRMSFGIFMDLIGLTDGEKGDVWRVCYCAYPACKQRKTTGSGWIKCTSTVIIDQRVWCEMSKYLGWRKYKNLSNMVPSHSEFSLQFHFKWLSHIQMTHLTYWALLLSQELW